MGRDLDRLALRRWMGGRVVTWSASTVLVLFGVAAAWMGVSRTSPSVRPGWDAGIAGQHRRLETPNGPVHLFLPRAYNSSTAGTVYYVHGYFNDVDQAWKQHELAAQFAASGRNALFVVPEAPTTNTEPVKWPSLGPLMETVTRQGDIEIPGGPAVVMVHSGGFRTMQGWLPSGNVDTVLLLDGLYGAEAELTEWLGDKGNHRGSLVLVGFDTAGKMEKFVDSFPDARIFEEVPPLIRAKALSPEGRVMFMRSQFGHMEIVTEGAVIPSVLQLTPLSAVGSSS